MSAKKLIQCFEEKLSKDDFVRPGHLVEIGLFGSQTSVINACRKGILPYLRVSSHRILIPRQSVLEHIKKSVGDTCCG